MPLVTAVTSTPKKGKKTTTHPPTAEMVKNAIKSLKERGGSSLQAIKKYISTNYLVDVGKISPFIKKYLKNAVNSGVLIQTSGKGASGSFKLDTLVEKKETQKKEKKLTVPLAPRKQEKKKVPAYMWFYSPKLPKLKCPSSKKPISAKSRISLVISPIKKTVTNRKPRGLWIYDPLLDLDLFPRHSKK